MSSTGLTIPRRAAPPRSRPPKPNIPQTIAERRHIVRTVRNYVAEFNPVPPLPLTEVAKHSSRVVSILQCDPLYHAYIGVLISNEMWRETLASVPYERRLLLLPKCLRVESKCPAPFDEFGLLCSHCGLCSIHDLQAEAERLGYAVLVAEGSAVVMSLIQSHKVEAIIGVSCLNVLERAFSYMEAAAIPGIAIPLLQDDCVETTVDLDWVQDYIHLSTTDTTRRLDLNALRDEVDSWFTPASLNRIMGNPEGQTEEIARAWVARAGKRWRPFLATAAFQALRNETTEPLPQDIKNVAAAVECFHKASLIHDDIEDGDTERYGEATLHEEVGLEVALNVGDLLVGEGYRLIASSGLSAEQKSRMLTFAAQGQRQLCRGQGAELCWMRSPSPLTSLQVLDIFRHKTAPAFEVALHLGALCAGCDPHESVAGVLAAYSEALGIAYQIRDDIEDFAAGRGGDTGKLCPSLLLAIAHEKAVDAADKQLTATLWTRRLPETGMPSDFPALCNKLKVGEHAQSFLESYKKEAVQSLDTLENPSLKGLLRRIIGKIFNETGLDAWCLEVREQSGK